MKLKALAAALLLTGVATTANAQYRDYDRDGYRDGYRDRTQYDARYDHDRDGRADRYERRVERSRYGDDRVVRRYERRYYATHRYQPRVRWVAPRGYRADRWTVGRRLPTGYYGTSYYVDYRPYRLNAPQRGYRWVRVDRDVYLVDLRTGMVADVRYDLFY